MNSVETKMVEMVFEYNDKLKNSNNGLKLEIKKLKDKIEELENSFNNPDNRLEAMQKKLDYYEKHFTDMLVWCIPEVNKPECDKLYLCLVFNPRSNMKTYDLLKYNCDEMGWTNILNTYWLSSHCILKYAELPEFNKGENYGQ